MSEPQDHRSVGWETVNVFVSSTFNDMHAERDYLVKEVFPGLREWCERRKLRLVDVDLRWGVTEADATKHKRVVDVCLRKIDDCRPFFICLLGQRYGWIPRRGDLADQTLRDFPGLEKVIEAASVTEMEILHSCVEPMSKQARAEHAFFYLREPSCMAKLPEKPAQLRRIYSDAVEADPKSHAFLLQKLAELRDEKIQKTGRPVHHYQASWDPTQKTPEIAMPLRCPATMAENQEGWRRQWREEAGVEVTGLDAAADAAALAIAQAHNAGLTQGRLGDFCCDGRPLGEVICEDLQAAIAARFPDHVEVTDQTDLEREIALHEEFVYTATEGFIERSDDFAALDAWVDDGADRRLLAVVAPGGVGKSTLLAKWVHRRRDRGEKVFCRFIGVGDRSASVDTLLSFLVDELRASGRLTADVPDDPRKLRGKLAELLADCGKKGKTVLVLDALDQLESGLSDLDWLPLALAEGVKLVVSCKRGEPGADKLESTWRTGDRVQVHERRGFENQEDRKKLVRAYLNQFLKELDEEHLQALTSAPGADNPLFLRVVLSELRVFGSFGDLGRQIRDGFGDTPVSAFDAVLKRLESDPPPVGLDPHWTVPILFGLLAHSRAGLPKQALADLLLEEMGLSPDLRPAIEATLETTLRQVRPFLARREGRTDFFYASFRAAAQKRYAREDAGLPARPAAAWHKSIACWCDSWLEIKGEAKGYALGTLVHHLLAAGDVDRAAEAMTDFGYHYERLEELGAGEVSNVARDFTALLQTRLSPNQRRLVETWQLFHAEIAHSLRRLGTRPEIELMQRAYAHADNSPLTHSASAWLEQHSPRHSWLRKLWRPKQLARSHCLRILEGHTDKVISVALHPDGRRAISVDDFEGLKIWDLETGDCLRTFRDHDSLNNGVGPTVAITRDGRRMLRRCGSSLICVWDLDTGTSIRLEGIRWFNSLVVDEEKQRALTWGFGDDDDKIGRVWNLKTGKCLRTFDAPSWVKGVALHPDGRRAVATGGKELRVWDLESGACVRTIQHQNEIGKYVAFSANGRRMIASSRFGWPILVWELETGRFVRTLQPHHGVAGLDISVVVLHPDGRRVLTGCSDGAVRVCDLETGVFLTTLNGHTSQVSAIAIHPDGRRVVTVCNTWHKEIPADKTGRVWDIETGACLQTLQGHIGGVTAVVVHPDGRRAVTASEDKTVRVWDISTPQAANISTGIAPGLDTDVCPGTLSGDTSQCQWVAFCADGQRAMSATGNKLRIWDSETGSCLRTLDAHPGDIWLTPFVTDEMRLVSIGAAELRVWDLEKGACLRTLKGHSSVSQVALGAGGRQVVTAGDYSDKTVRVWDVETGTCLRTLNLGQYAGWADRVALTADGRRVLLVRSGSLLVWDTRTGELLKSLGPSNDALGWTLGRNTKGRRVASIDATSVNLWDIKTGTLAGTIYHGRLSYLAAVSADGRRAILKWEGRTLGVLDLESGTCVHVLEGQADNIVSVAFDDRGERALTVGDDKTLQLWDLKKGVCLGTYFGALPFTELALGRPLANGRARIVAGCADGAVHFFELVPPRIVTTRNSGSRLGRSSPNQTYIPRNP